MISKYVYRNKIKTNYETQFLINLMLRDEIKKKMVRKRT